MEVKLQVFIDLGQILLYTVKDIYEVKRLENSDVSSEDVQMIFSGVDTSSVIEEIEVLSEIASL